MLGARIAADGQWRFPELDTVPEKFEKCILHFEDAYFYSHPGFNPVAMAKATWHNITRKTRRGGSTLTQQVIRLSRKNQRRSYLEKGIELVMATRLEAGYSKQEILALYASHAPFGGNVVGLEAAAWRYYGLPPQQLGWGQMAALAILPNAPALVYPGAKDQRLREKRDRLLMKLLKTHVLDSMAYMLALEEELPQKPLPLPETAPHLVEYLRQKTSSKRWKTSLSYELQKQCNRIIAAHYGVLRQNQVHNAAVLVLNVRTKEVLAYIGNTPTTPEHASKVDIVQRVRSTGSILKPFLFAAALDDGLILPRTLLEDIPTTVNGYTPENFDQGFDGAVPANVALSRSLNVPAVRLLRSYGLARFYRTLPKLGIGSVGKPADYYGLSLILGGAEASLWDLTNAYAGMAATLNNYLQGSSGYLPDSFGQAGFEERSQPGTEEKIADAPVFGAGSIYNVLEALQEVNRPSGEENWSFFNGARPLAWKTGTSYGFKDAWAIGTTPDYAIGVWVGNADGEGRPGLTGIQAAAPLLFEVLETLPRTDWFQIPYDDLVRAQVCTHSGYLAGPECESVQETFISEKGLQGLTCPFHQMLHLDATGGYQVNADCYPLDRMLHKTWFILPPVPAYYYGKKHPEYREVPPYLPGCSPESGPVMEFVFPKKNETVLIPRELGGNLGQVIFVLAHQQPWQKVYWYLDDRFLGTTEQFHELSVSPEPGIYMLTVMDSEGHRLQEEITIEMASGEDR